MGQKGRIMKRRDNLSLKNSKPFEFNDLFIYITIAFIVLVLFSLFVFFPKHANSDGFTVYKGKTEILTFYYKDCVIDNKSNLTVENKSTDNGVYITIYHTKDKKSFNVLFVNTIQKTVVMHDSTCSNSKDCTHSPAIQNNGAIYCAPHDLKIVPIGSNGKVPPTTGGISL